MCFKKPTACDPGDSLWILADHDGFLAYLQGSLGSCYLQANVMETPHTAFKVSCLLAEDPWASAAQRTTAAHVQLTGPVAGTRLPVKARAGASSGIPAAHSPDFFSLFFFFQIHPMLATIIPHLDSCNSDITGAVITVISRTLSVIPCIMRRTPYPKLFLGKYLLVFQDSARVSSPPGNLSLPPKTKSGASSLTCVCVHTRVRTRMLTQSCLFDPLGCSPPGPSVHGNSQARVLESAAISSLGGSSRPRDRAHISCISCICRQILHFCTAWEDHSTPDTANYPSWDKPSS